MITHKGWVVLAVSLLLVLLASPKQTDSSITQPPAGIPSKPIHQQITKKEPQKDSLSIWIDKLATKEKCPVKGIIDSNHKMSYGCLCFQKETFIRQSRLYLMPHATNEEILSRIGSCQFQKKLAYEMISHDKAKIYHWKLSVKKIGEP